MVINTSSLDEIESVGSSTNEEETKQPLVKSCCGCCSLGAGSLTIAIIYLGLGVSFIVTRYNDLKIFMGKNSKIWGGVNTFLDVWRLLLVFGLIIAVISIVGCSILAAASCMWGQKEHYKKMKKSILIWCLLTFLLILFNIGEVLFVSLIPNKAIRVSHNLETKNPIQSLIKMIVLTVVHAMFYLYFVIVLVSYLRLLKYKKITKLGGSDYQEKKKISDIVLEEKYYGLSKASSLASGINCTPGILTELEQGTIEKKEEQSSQKAVAIVEEKPKDLPKSPVKKTPPNVKPTSEDIQNNKNKASSIEKEDRDHIEILSPPDLKKSFKINDVTPTTEMLLSVIYDLPPLEEESNEPATKEIKEKKIEKKQEVDEKKQEKEETKDEKNVYMNILSSSGISPEEKCQTEEPTLDAKEDDEPMIKNVIKSEIDDTESDTLHIKQTKDSLIDKKVTESESLDILEKDVEPIRSTSRISARRVNSDLKIRDPVKRIETRDKEELSLQQVKQFFDGLSRRTHPFDEDNFGGHSTNPVEEMFRIFGSELCRQNPQQSNRYFKAYKDIQSNNYNLNNNQDIFEKLARIELEHQQQFHQRYIESDLTSEYHHGGFIMDTSNTKKGYGFKRSTNEDLIDDPTHGFHLPTRVPCRTKQLSEPESSFSTWDESSTAVGSSYDPYLEEDPYIGSSCSCCTSIYDSYGNGIYEGCYQDSLSTYYPDHQTFQAYPDHQKWSLPFDPHGTRWAPLPQSPGIPINHNESEDDYFYKSFYDPQYLSQYKDSSSFRDDTTFCSTAHKRIPEVDDVYNRRVTQSTFHPISRISRRKTPYDQQTQMSLRKYPESFKGSASNSPTSLKSSYRDAHMTSYLNDIKQRRHSVASGAEQEYLHTRSSNKSREDDFRILPETAQSRSSSDFSRYFRKKRRSEDDLRFRR